MTSSTSGDVVPRTVHRTALVLAVACAAAAMLDGCAAEPGQLPTSSAVSSQEATADPSSVGPLPSRSSAFQIRPVIAVEATGPGDCAEQPADPPLDLPARACDAPGPDQAVYDLGPARITLDDVAEVEVADSMGAPVVHVTLNAAGAAALADLTTELAQNQIPASMAAIMLHGRVQSAPVVQATISSGALELNGFATVAEAQQVADTLTRPGS